MTNSIWVTFFWPNPCSRAQLDTDSMNRVRFLRIAGSFNCSIISIGLKLLQSGFLCLEHVEYCGKSRYFKYFLNGTL